MGRLHWMNQDGDAETVWDPQNPQSVRKAREVFNKAIASRALAFALNNQHKPGERISQFDSAAKEILIVPQIKGG